MCKSSREEKYSTFPEKHDYDLINVWKKVSIDCKSYYLIFFLWYFIDFTTGIIQAYLDLYLQEGFSLRIQFL